MCTPKKLIIALALVAIITLGWVLYWQIKPEEKADLNKIFVNPSSFDLKLSHKKPSLADISEEEAIKIGKEIDKFEQYKYKKDFAGAIILLTPPENQEEEGWLDHFLGNDLILQNGEPFPRFSNKVYHHLLAGYDIDKIIKGDTAIYVYIKELRVLNIAEDRSDPNYKAELQDLTFELLTSPEGYKISKYYHTQLTSVANLKYEGFVAD